MRNLILLLIRYHTFLLFLLLEGVCVLLIVQNNTYHKASFINSSNSLVGSLYAFSDGMVEYFQLSDDNEALAEENARLRAELNQARFKQFSGQVEVDNIGYN